MQTLKRNKYLLQLILLVLILLTVVLVGKENNLFSQWEHLITDSLFVQTTAPRQVTIVGIDEASLERYGAWPWDRSIFAQLVSKLDAAQVRALAFDVTFFESRSGDAALVEALRTATTPVILAGKLEGGEFLQPNADLIQAENVYVGYANLFEDADGKVRDSQLVSHIAQGAHPSFAYRALLSYFGQKDVNYAQVLPALGFTNLPDNGQLIINYVGAKSTVSTISLQALLADDFDTSILKDQLIFIGSTVQDLKFGLDDNLITPVGIMPGVEIHANIASTVINNSVLYPSDPNVENFVLVLLAVIATILIALLPFVAAAAIILITASVYLIAMIVAFGTGYLGDFLYTPLVLVLLVIGGLGWRYLGKYIESMGLRRAFSQYVNEQLLAEILKDPGKLKLGGERRNMTVFFSDIRGFTTISERMDAEKLVEFLNVYLTRATDKILQHNGVVDKYLGDAIMALWGAPLLDEHHALNSCLAALDILQVLAEFNQDSQLDIPELKIGIGINTGEMVVGNMGSERRFDYTVMGDNVNLASRLEGLTKKYHCEIVLGEGVVAELERTGDKSKLIYRWIDTVAVKGKEKPVKLYQLLAASDLAHKIELTDMVKQYEQALLKYLAGDFVAAETDFHKVAASFKDEVANVMAERCAELAKSSEWKGYWVWDTK